MTIHDVVVLGGGPGGYATAFRAAARGLDVAIVEERELGGTCLHRGCVPSKALLHVAAVLEAIQGAGAVGVSATSEGLDVEAMHRFRHEVVDRLHRGLEGLVAGRATLHRGRGRLVRAADGGLAVALAPRPGEGGGDDEPVRGRHTVLATGSVPRTIPGIVVDGEVVQTSEQALTSTRIPTRVVIVGAGAIGMEFASIWRPMGAEVTVVEALDRVLPLEDADSSRALEQAFRRRGIEVLTSTRVVGLEVTGGVATLRLEGSDGATTSRTADRVLIAVGRAPNTGETGAEELGILDGSGFVRTDPFGATEVEGLWAVGDVRPTLALAHAAFVEGFVVADRIAQVAGTVAVDHVQVPRVTYSHPQVASVGLTEEEARDRYGDEAVAVVTTQLHGNAAAVIAGERGHVKVVHRADGPPAGAPGAAGAVVGVHVVGPQATEVIGQATLVTSWGAVPDELTAIAYAHPSVHEALGEAFQAAAGVPFHGA